MCFIPLSAQYYLDDFVYGVVICTFHDQAKKENTFDPYIAACLSAVQYSTVLHARLCTFNFVTQ